MSMNRLTHLQKRKQQLSHLDFTFLKYSIHLQLKRISIQTMNLTFHSEKVNRIWTVMFSTLLPKMLTSDPVPVEAHLPKAPPGADPKKKIREDQTNFKQPSKKALPNSNRNCRESRSRTYPCRLGRSLASQTSGSRTLTCQSYQTFRPLSEEVRKLTK